MPKIIVHNSATVPTVDGSRPPAGEILRIFRDAEALAKAEIKQNKIRRTFAEHCVHPRFKEYLLWKEMVHKSYVDFCHQVEEMQKLNTMDDTEEVQNARALAIKKMDEIFDFDETARGKVDKLQSELKMAIRDSQIVLKCSLVPGCVFPSGIIANIRNFL